MYVLGISCYYHDSAAALIKDGEVVAASQEERFTRKKHDTSFPINSIKYCLESQNIEINQIDHVAFYEKPILKFERILSQCIEGFPYSYKQFIKALPSWLTEKLRIPKTLKKKLKYKGDVMFVEHHLSHAASAFLPSPFEKAAIVSIDGVGEWTTTAHGVGHNNSIQLHKKIDFPHSLGLLYSTITAYLGFSVNNSEYKVMGLSPYGTMDRNENRYYKKMLQIIKINDDGSFSLDMDFFSYHKMEKMPSIKMCKLLGGPIRKGNDALNRRHKDIAAALQMIYEDALFNLLNYVQKETKEENLVLAGGCALNSVANGKILSKTKFKNLWIPPDPGDGGNSIGAAAYAYSSILKKGNIKQLDDPFLGPSFSNEEIKDFLDSNKINYEYISNSEELIERTAQLIYKDNVIGWFQKGMEWGPRALGGRSILSNPCNPKMQEILNSKVKHREMFRPFAPVVCDDDADKYFDIDKPLPLPTDFMLMVYPIKESFRDKIPAVTHVDGSGRLQTIRRKQNELYYDLIKKFGELSGVPILINTSFNIRGEPIVCTPEDAYRCMMGTGIDKLVLGNYLITRIDNPNDIWDCEALAKD